MPRHLYMVLLALLCTASFPAALNAQQEGVPWVVRRTTGEGDSEQEAFDNARAKALAKIVDIYLQERRLRGRTKQWTRRLVTADPDYVVGRACKTVGKPRHDDIRNRWHVTVSTELPPGRLEDAAKEATEFLDWFGNPRVQIFFAESMGPTKDTGREPEEDSDVAQGLLEAFSDAEFRVTVDSQTEKLRKKHAELDRLDLRDIKTLLGEALRADTDMIVVGFVRVTGPERHAATPKRSMYYWNADADCKVFWTDTGELIAAESKAVKASDTNRDTARIQTLQKAGRMLAGDLLDSVFRKWSVLAFEGRTVTITVLECSNAEADMIVDRIRGTKKVPGLLGNTISKIEDERFLANGLELSVVTKLPSRQLSRAIRDQFSGDFELEGTEELPHSIRMKLVH